MPGASSLWRERGKQGSRNVQETCIAQNISKKFMEAALLERTAEDAGGEDGRS